MNRKCLTLAICFLMILTTSLSAQKTTTGERYGKALNLGLGIGGYSGYYGYVDRSLPVFHINYEFDVANNFTLAPFATFFSYTNTKYHYHETTVPIGVKGSFYLDQLLKANSNWDFYVAGSLGFTVVNSKWEEGYDKNENYHGPESLFLDIHLGAEYHFNSNIGAFLDLSSGVSTIGIAIH